ncbi:MAG: hypothetical protein IKU11_10745 [Clostridia bacterium]|nr:hypothetical protein [Clostridia bacterium]
MNHHMVYRIVTVLFLLLPVFLSGCHVQTEEFPTEDPALHGESISNSEASFSNQSMEEKLAQIIDSEKESLYQDLLYEMANDPLFQDENTPPLEQYEAYRNMMDEMETLMSQMGEDADRNKKLQKEIQEIQKQVNDLDPKGEIFLYDEKLHAAVGNYGVYAYYNGEESPYREGIDEEKTDFFPDPMENYVLSNWPQGMIWYSLVPCAVTGRIVEQGECTIDLSAGLSPEALEKELEAGGALEIVQPYYMLEISECFWGGFEKGDRFAFVPRSLSKELRAELEKGEEWMFFLGYDGEDYAVEHEGKHFDSYSTRTHAIFRVTDGRAYSISRYRDFTQYDGSTPEELALSMLRIRERYPQALKEGF